MPGSHALETSRPSPRGVTAGPYRRVVTRDPTPAQTWAELLEAVSRPDQEGWARTLEPAVALAAADPVLSGLFVEATWDEIRLGVEFPVDDEGPLPYLWPEAAGFDLQHGLRRRPEGHDEDRWVVVRFAGSDGRSQVELSEILPEDRCLERWDELRRRWDAEALADPRFMVVDPLADEPLGRHLTPEEAVTLWSAAVARALAAEG